VTYETVELAPSDPAWVSFVEHSPDALPFHHPSWASLLAECYAYRPFVLAVLGATGDILGGVPALEVSRPFGRRRWVSLPFTDYCPLLAKSGAQAAVARAIVGAASAQRVDALEVRAALPQGERVHTSVCAVRHTLALASDPGTVMARISKHHRRNIRRSEQSDLRIRFGSSTRDMAVFYQLHLMTRKRLGVPAQPWRFFELLAHVLRREQLGFVLLAYLDQSPVAAAVFLAWRDVLVYKYGASDPQFWEHRPNNLLFSQAIRWGCEQGYTTFDWGRSDLDQQGLREFKSGWGANEEPLAYSAVCDRPPVTGSGRVGRAMATVIRRSPTWVCRAMGQVLYRYAA
jgi:CelD/BcsL family acetyltransferase involved in cellulose biosynthesis